MKGMREIRLEVFRDLTVLTGPFRGMKYPSPRSFGSPLLPKLLGSYESELHEVLEELSSNRYTRIINIGCAEGFYAVGLGLRFPDADIHAFDIDSEARQLCRNLGKLNGVDQQLTVGEYCGQATLRSLLCGQKALVVSDCEGCEYDLFTEEIADFLAGHDLIVETHDFIRVSVSSRLREVFGKTHQIRSVKSVEDIEKATTYECQQLDKCDAATRRSIVAEHRPAAMEWLVMTSKIRGVSQ
jgi:hypothetical protein